MEDRDTLSLIAGFKNRRIIVKSAWKNKER